MVLLQVTAVVLILGFVIDSRLLFLERFGDFCEVVGATVLETFGGVVVV